MHKKILITLFCSVCYIATYGQLAEKKSYPVIGEECPDFVLTDVNYYSKTQVSLNDLKGKFTILDFWGRNCSACFASWPKITKLQEKFKDKINFLLIGKDDSLARPIYEKYRKKYDLPPVAYETELFDKFLITGVPYVVWINDQGIVKAVTIASDLTEENLNMFINGQDFKFYDASYNTQIKNNLVYNEDLPLLINNNGGSNDTNFIYRSLLSKWQPGMGITGANDIDYYLRRENPLPKFECLGQPLVKLYTLAYTGQWGLDTSIYSRIILETKDSLLLDYSQDQNLPLYCYSLITQKNKATKENFMKIMQNDLLSNFGYQLNIEERKVPCYRLIKYNKNGSVNISTSGAEPLYELSPIKLKMVNIPINDLTFILSVKTTKWIEILNETGIKGNIDIQLDAAIDQLDDVRATLRKYNLDLVEGRHNKKAIVIKDQINRDN